MSDGVEKVIEALGVFIIVAIAGWMMRDIEIAEPLGTWWFILGGLGSCCYCGYSAFKAFG